MCLSCQLNCSDESVVTMFKEALENPQFEKWNTTSFNHIILSISGLSGEEAHNLALTLAEQFYQWLPDSLVRKRIDRAKVFYEENKDKSKEEMVLLLTS